MVIIWVRVKLLEAAGRLAAVTQSGRIIARYRYDYRGLRRQKSTEDGTTDFTYDPSGHLISQQTREGRDEGQRDYLWTDTAPIARIDSPLGQAKVHKDWLPQALMGFLHRHEREEHGHATPLYYLHTDAMGTPKLATNEKQQVVWRWNEDAFGATVPAEQNRHGYRDHDRDHGSHGIEVNLRYPGQYYDSETGLFYNWNRYYNPNTGRYSRSDPIGLSGGVNTFGYVSANPLGFIDPWGLFGSNQVSGIPNTYNSGDVRGAFLPNGDSANYSPATYNPDAASKAMILGALLSAGLVYGAEELAAIWAGEEAGAVGEACEVETTVIGRVKDLNNLDKGERSLLDRLPDQGNPKANWQQNSRVLRLEMSRGNPIRDASPGDNAGQFLNAERNLLSDRGWTLDPKTNYWNPPAK